MESFISKLVEKIDTDRSDLNFSDTLVVLPNRRAHRKLISQLAAKHKDATFFAPVVYPMDEFVAFLSPLKSIDTNKQILRLHEITKDIPNERCKLENLNSWGFPFLHDISDMDMQMQEDIPSLLNDYAMTAAFEFPFGKDEPTEHDKILIDFYRLLSEIYSKYRSLLLKNGEAYTGLLYRDCADNIEKYANKINFKRILFAGFYALSPSELIIVKHIKDNFATDILFDVDPFYCDLDVKSEHDVLRQTSFFINRDCQFLDIKDVEYLDDSYETQKKNINIVATSKNLRQVYSALDTVRNIIKVKSEDGVVDMTDTAVVLADETLLMPFLSAYNIKDVELNVTMGIPFSSTSVYADISEQIAVYENSLMLATESGYEIVIDEIHSVKRNEVGRKLPSLIASFCEKLSESLEENNDVVLCQEAAKRMKDLQFDYDESFSEDQEVDFLLSKRLVLNVLDKIQISRTGDSNRGLQVMGLLETRMLDFKNVIILSVNEGVLPKGLRYDSLLPFDFKYKFGNKFALENYLYQEHVYAYHFFRLMQRAENITLIYNSLSDNAIAEVSHFVSQMKYKARLNKMENLHFSDVFKDFDLKLTDYNDIQIEKTDEIVSKLNQFCFSASALKNYVECPVKFYFKNIAKIEKNNPLTDEMASNELGNVVHKTFSDVFDKIMKERDRNKYNSIIDSYIDNISDVVVGNIRKEKGREDIEDAQLNQGAWIINRHIIEENVKNYLKVSKDELKNPLLTIIGNEKKYYATVLIDNPNKEDSEIKVEIKGTFDRIQQLGGYIEILDYKTGNVDSKTLNIKTETKAKDDNSGNGNNSRDDMVYACLFENPDYEKLMQLVFYMILYKNSKETCDLTVRAGIIANKAVNRGDEEYIFMGSIDGNENLSEEYGVLEACLKRVLGEIFDQGTPFKCTEDKDVCKRCDYSAICKM